MDDKKLFSIAVIAYNQEKFIGNCLDSIGFQKYRPLEIILYDDASKDSTFQIMEEWKAVNNDLNVKIFRNERNRGISYTHNEAVKKAKGYFFKYIGGDDVLEDNAIGRIVDFFCSNDHINCVMSRVRTFFDYGELKNNTGSVLPPNKEMDFFRKSSDLQYLDLVYKNDIVAPGMFFKKKALEAVDYFDPDFRKFEDYHTWLKLARAGYRFYFFPEILVNWRRHPDSVSFSAWSRGDVEYKKEELEVIKKYVQPYIRSLPLTYRFHVFYKKIYLKSLLKFGVSKYYHKIFRVVNLLDPLWLKRLPGYLKNKICK